MGKIYRIFLLFNFIFGLQTFLAQENSVNFTAYLPKYISENKSTLLISKNYFACNYADSLVLKLSYSRLSISDSIFICTRDTSFYQKIENGLGETYLKLNKKKLGLINNTASLFYFEIYTEQTEEINFDINLFENGNRVYEISSSDLNSEGDYLLPAIFQPYKENPRKDEILFFEDESELVYSVKFPNEYNNKISFWLKSLSLSILCSVKFVSPNTKDTLLSLYVDKFGVFRTENFALSKSKEFFLFPNAWTKITFSFSQLQNEILINDEKAFESNSLTNFSDSLLLIISAGINGGKFFINNPEIVSESEDSVLVRKQLKLNDIYENPNVLRAENCKLELTEFPIISSPPEINITITSAYTTVEFYNTEDDDLKKFILQKANGYGSFINVFSVENPIKGKHYFFEDYNFEKTGVAFYRVMQINKNGESVFSHQVKVGKAKIKDFEIEQNYPNPFNPTTNITVNVIIPGYFRIGVFDLVGKEIKVLHNGTLSQGRYDFRFDAENLPSGIYLLRVKSLNNTIVRKMIFTK